MSIQTRVFYEAKLWHAARSFLARLSVSYLIVATGCSSGNVTLGGAPTLPGNPGGFARTRATSGAFRVLYSLGGNSSDSFNPVSGITEIKDTLYGATRYGGPGNFGTVFGVSMGGGESVLCNTQVLSEPLAGLIHVNGTLYGTTYLGGRHGRGSVFSMSPGCKMKTLHEFRGGSDGAFPRAQLLDVQGTLYGTTQGGGYSKACPGCGTVFSIDGAGNEKIIYHFNGSTGAGPTASVIYVNGLLYGTTRGGGAYGHGTVYSLSITGQERVLHSFAGGTADGAYPDARLTFYNGNLYGTTETGGSYQSSGSGAGTIFSVNTNGAEHVVYQFQGGADGATPYSHLINVNGTFYGTTSSGGNPCNCGTIYSVDTDGNHHTLYRLKEYRKVRDGVSPEDLLYIDGTLYGTTYSGGQYDGGTVFAFTP
jgi:uncharacterized repeat protein (TIGR03803 family)